MTLNTIVLLIIASEGYQHLEYGHTREVLEEAGIKVVVASNLSGTASANASARHAQVCDDPTCRNVGSEYASAHVDVVLSSVNADEYAGIFIIGGPGALEFLDNQTTYRIMRKIAKAQKPFGAICISPRILASAGLLKGKRATGWNGDNKLNAHFKKHEVHYVKEPVVVDGNIITADGPQAAKDFGKAIVKALQRR